MAISPARAAACEILLKVERDRSFSDELLHAERFNKLSSIDHGLTTDLVRGVLRWRSRLAEWAAEASSQKLERLDPEVLVALLLGVYQLKFLTRVPARAAIFESVELVKAARKRSAASFVNAVLRKVAAGDGAAGTQPARDLFAAIEASPDPIALARNSAHPEWLVTRWIRCYGLAATRQICIHDQHVPKTSIHVCEDEALDLLARDGVKLGQGRLVSFARTVVSGDITRTGVYLGRRVAIQDEGSQLVALLVGRGNRILDCCAAPGGKASLMARRNPGALVLACELHVHRALLLRKLVRMPNVRTIIADARSLPFSLGFDRILADVPCSGTGTLARNPEIKWRLKPEDLNRLADIQALILANALNVLAPSGRLIYATCSLEPEENESVVQAVLRQNPDFSRVGRDDLAREHPQISTLLDDQGCFRTRPDLHSMDGFFAAVIARRGCLAS